MRQWVRTHILHGLDGGDLVEMGGEDWADVDGGGCIVEVGVQKITSMNERNRWDNLEALSLNEIEGLSRMIIKESNYLKLLIFLCSMPKVRITI